MCFILFLSLAELIFEFFFITEPILVQIEEIMNCMDIFLSEFWTESIQELLKLFEIDLFIPADVAGSEKFIMTHILLFEKANKFESGFMLKWYIDIFIIHWSMLLSATVIGFQSIIIFLDCNIAFEILIKDYDQTGYLGSAQLEIVLQDLLLEIVA